MCGHTRSPQGRWYLCVCVCVCARARAGLRWKCSVAKTKKKQKDPDCDAVWGAFRVTEKIVEMEAGLRPPPHLSLLSLSLSLSLTHSLAHSLTHSLPLSLSLSLSISLSLSAHPPRKHAGADNHPSQASTSTSIRRRERGPRCPAKSPG